MLLSSRAFIKAGIFDNLQPVLIATGMQFTEGPAWHPDGYLVFSDCDANIIYKWSESDGLDTLVSSSGSANGIACSKSNAFYICRQSTRDIASLSASGVVSSYVSGYNNKKFNSPNDVELSYLGSIYFTDPDFGLNTSSREFSYEGLFCIPYNQTSAVLLDSTLVHPNGMTFSNDWRTLYVAESSTGKIYSYYLRDEYKVQDYSKDKKVFLTVSGSGEIDGLTADIFGNIYVAYGNGGVLIYDRNASLVGQISFPSTIKVRNLCFGGKYQNILFITAGTSIYKVEIRFYGDFIAPGLLGVPTNSSVKFNAISDKTLDAYIAYGTDSANLSMNTTVTRYTGGIPMLIKMDGLTANTKYYYQLIYKQSDSTAYKSGISGHFFTQRASGSVFSFAVEADPHLDEGSNYMTFRNTLQNAYNLNPDFLIDLGDNFMVEKYPIMDSFYMETRSLLYRNFWDNVCKSVPLFIAQGNHDTELRWLSTNTANDPFNTATRIRKRNYPTPEPDGFYTGSESSELYVGLRENYYSWTWGDALFVVIDPYGYTEDKTNDPWCFTLGKTQYDWFRSTLESSSARYKFVFAHQLIGGDNLGRGGVEYAPYFENGGYNADGTYGFDDKRSGWGKPLHQIMIDNGVQIYFHGHDHFYAQQEKDGLIYQEVPQPSFPGYTTANSAASYGYVTGTILPNSGHLNVTILGDSAKIDYIGGYHVNNTSLGQVNGNIRNTYYVKANNITTKVGTVEKGNPIKCYQSGNTFFVEANSEINAPIELYSINGQKVAVLSTAVIPRGTSEYILPESLIKGLYLINIRNSEINKTYKVVKNI